MARGSCAEMTRARVERCSAGMYHCVDVDGERDICDGCYASRDGIFVVSW